MNPNDWSTYIVHLHSKPSPAWTFYEGEIQVVAEDSECAKERAVGKLKRTTFPDRPLDGWVVDRVELA